MTWQNVSQYGNAGYKGPALMVLGNVGDAPVCYYCNKPGHIRADCYKMRNDLAAGRGQTGSIHGGHGGRGGRGGSRNGGRPHGGRTQLNAIAEGTMDVQEVMRLGMEAAANKQQ